MTKTQEVSRTKPINNLQIMNSQMLPPKWEHVLRDAQRSLRHRVTWSAGLTGGRPTLWCGTGRVRQNSSGYCDRVGVRLWLDGTASRADVPCDQTLIIRTERQLREIIALPRQERR